MSAAGLGYCAALSAQGHQEYGQGQCSKVNRSQSGSYYRIFINLSILVRIIIKQNDLKAFVRFLFCQGVVLYRE